MPRLTVDWTSARRWPAGAAVVAVAALLVGGAPLAAAQECSGCHEAIPAVLAAGPHAAVACVQCHPGAEVQPHRGLEGPQCASAGCHLEVGAVFLASEHDRKWVAGREGAPTCAGCHGGHETAAGLAALAGACRSDADATCGDCHEDARRDSCASGHRPAAGVAPACASGGLACAACHGAHAVHSVGDPGSPVSRPRVAATCGRCHVTQEADYRRSRHGRSIERGSELGPTCVSCHGGHVVGGCDGADAPVDSEHVVATCLSCHQDPRVVEQADLPTGVVDGYERSFHGIANSHGAADVATCASCHEPHRTLPSSDPESWVHPANLQRTCVRCHDSVDDLMIAAVRHTGSEGLLGRWAGLRLFLPVAGTTIHPLAIIVLGMGVGLLTGVFGVGAGFLMTPLLMFLGIPPAVAAASDAGHMTAAASSDAVAHSRQRGVDLRLVGLLVLGGVIGAWLGVLGVHALRAAGRFDFVLKSVYVVVLAFIGLSTLLEGARARSGDRREQRRAPRSHRILHRLPLPVQLPASSVAVSALLPVGIGLVAGVAIAVLGGAGGFLTLPLLIYVVGAPARVAIGTDVVQTTATCGVVTLLHAAINHTVDLPLALMVFAGVVVGARFGGGIARRWQPEGLRLLLAVSALAVMIALAVQLTASPNGCIALVASGGLR